MESSNSFQEVKDVQQTVEMYEQQLHELQTQLATSRMMEKELSADLEAMQKKYDKDQAAAALREKDLEEKYSLSLKELSHKIDLLEKDKTSEGDAHKTQMLEMACKVKMLEQQLKAVPDSHNNDVLKELQLENAVLQEKETELHVEYQQLQDKSIALTSKIAELTSNLNEANKCLAAKQEDLTSYMSCLKSAQEELAVMRTELEILKSDPQTYGQKGNSLFSEVEDKRLSMQKKLDAAVQKYRHLKKVYMDKCAEENMFSAELMFLRQKWDQLQSETQEQKKQLIESYKTRIKDLEEQVQKLKGQKSPYVISNADNATLKFVEAYIESSRKECMMLKEELEAKSVCALFSSETLFNIQQELRRKEAELVHAKVQVMELQVQLKEKKEKLED